MDTPLVKILLIAAAIAITVGVTVLAWSIFNEGSSEVETDQDERAISTEAGTRADGVRARVDNERACEALGSAHWITKGSPDTDDNGKLLDAFTTTGRHDDYDTIFDHPATRTNEGESHCAAGADTRSAATGLTRQIILWVGDDKEATLADGEWRIFVLK